MSFRCAESGKTETVIQKSRFISYAFRAEDDLSLESALKKIRSNHAGYTHVCYGAVLDKDGLLYRFSDDGEPGGTAGQPICDAVKKSGFRQTAVAVVRFFGGIKLGAGGLTRAYGECAASVLRAAETAVYSECGIYKISLDFGLYGRLENFFKSCCLVTDIKFGETVEITAASENDLSIQLAEISNGKADALLSGNGIFKIRKN